MIDKWALYNAISEHTDMVGWSGNSILVEREVKDMVGTLPDIDAIELGKPYTSRDYIIETRQDGDAQTFIVRKRRS